MKLTDATVWFWTHGTPISNEFGEFTGEFTAADYVTYNLIGGVASTSGTPPPSNVIGSGQGFLIRAFSSGSVQFSNSMRVVGENDTQFFKSTSEKISATEEKDRFWLNMTSDTDGFSQILLGFMEDGTDGFDNGYDGLSLSSGSVILYSMIEDKSYAIQGFGSFDRTKEIPLGFYSALENKQHKIAIEKFERCFS